MIWNYESTPGSRGESPPQWPQNSAVARAPDRATLVLLAHPRCPCTKASVEELAHIMTLSQDHVRAQVLFYQPRGQPDNWTDTPLWRAASAVAGVSVRRDEGGVEARRFGAYTSGQAVLYDAKGRLLFSGGITGLRGHTGDNAGRRAIAALLAQGKADTTRTPVLGCSLEEPPFAGGKSHGSPRQRAL